MPVVQERGGGILQREKNPERAGWSRLICVFRGARETDGAPVFKGGILMMVVVTAAAPPPPGGEMM